MALSSQPWLRMVRPRRDALDVGDKVQVQRSDGSWTAGAVDDAEAKQLPPGSVRVATAEGDEVVPQEQVRTRIQRAARVSVIAPGGGLGSLGSVYAGLGKNAQLQVNVVGKKGTLYDCYPESWETGRPEPNLASFAADVARIGVPERTDCFIFGSRGGQVVLPTLWQALGDAVPASVVINGGCAMALPGSGVRWPDRAVTVMLLGGQDYFRGSLSGEDYVRSACDIVPRQNITTAIIYVPEMKHMPKKEMLACLLLPLVRAALSWQACPENIPLPCFTDAIDALCNLGWGGRLLYALGGGSWHEERFGPQVPETPVKPPSPRGPRPAQPAPIYPLGTAVSVTPIEIALKQTPQSHRNIAAQARADAVHFDIKASDLQSQLSRVEADSRHDRLQTETQQCNKVVLENLRFQLEDAKRRSRLLAEYAAGQEGEAYAAEADELTSRQTNDVHVQMTQTRDQRKERDVSHPATLLQQRVPPSPWQQTAPSLYKMPQPQSVLLGGQQHQTPVWARCPVGQQVASATHGYVVSCPGRSIIQPLHYLKHR